jgi:uncharacterized GH25 family protein
MLWWMAALVGLTTSFACGQPVGDFVSLEGVVLSHDGKVIYGAFIYLDPPEGDLPQHTLDWQSDRPDGFSAESGRFLIIGKPPGKYRLTVWIGKQRVHVLPVELKSDKQKIEIRLPPLPALKGKVVDDEGKPVPQMMVLLTNPESKEPWMSVSDSNGEFVFLLPPVGEANIVVMATAGDQPLTQQKVVIAGDKSEDLVLKLPKLPRLTVKLLKVDGKPLSNAPVAVTVWFKTSELKTDENGCVVLPPMSQVEKQKVLLRAKGEGWAIITVDLKQIPTEPISVRLQPFASVSGKVVNPEGEPIADAEVRVGPVTPNPFPIGNLEQKVRTDKQGQFRVRELWAGNFSFTVESESYRTTGVASNVVWVAPGQSKAVTIVAAPIKKPVLQKPISLGATISGQVFDPEGKPVAEATVQLNKQLPSPWGFIEAKPSEPVKTDEQGRFELKNAPSGWHILSARTKDGRDAAQWVYVPPAKGKPAQVSATLQIPKEFGSIKGKVLKDGGKTPAAGIGIMAIESHYYLVNMWDSEQAALNLQINENQTICVGGG